MYGRQHVMQNMQSHTSLCLSLSLYIYMSCVPVVTHPPHGNGSPGGSPSLWDEPFCRHWSCTFVTNLLYLPGQTKATSTATQGAPK